MNAERKERIVDDVLNRALGPHMAEPREGFEQRILANLATAPERRPWWRWMWVPAVAAAAVLAIVLGMRVMRHESPKSIEANKTHEAPKQEIARKTITPDGRMSPRRALGKHKSAATSSAAKVVAQAMAQPRMEVFPSPTPMTEQERLLLAFVHRNLDQAKTIAFEQQAERERIQKYFDGNDSSAADTAMPQDKR